MRDGALTQVGTPSEIYEQPSSRYVAGFIGEVNLFEQSDGSCLAVRPERMTLHRPTKALKAAQTNWVEGTLEEIGYLGSHSHFRVRLEDGRLVKVQATANVENIDYDEPVIVSWPTSAQVRLTT